MRKIFHLLNLFVVLGILPLSAQLTFNLPSTSATCGDFLEIPLTVENFDSLTEVQFALAWEPAALTYQTGESRIEKASALINDATAEEGQIIFTYTVPEGISLNAGDTILIVRFLVTLNQSSSTAIQIVEEGLRVLNQEERITPILNNGTIVIEQSNAPPVITNCLDTVVQYTTATSCMAMGLWEEPQFQSCNGVLTLESSHLLGASFEIGTRMITYSATDELGQTTICSFVHVVRDTIAPVISNCPEDFEVNFSTDAGCDLSVAWEAPSFLERCSSTETMVTSNFNSGDNFPVGNTIVIYEAADAAGNSSNCSFEVIVTGSDPITFDRRPENIVIPTQPGVCGATYDWSLPAAVSGCAPVNLVANFEPGSFFPVGTTVIEYVATDQINQRAIWAFSVTVEDNQVLSARCPEDIIIAANGQIANDTTNFVQSVASDNCGSYQLALNEIEVIDNCTSILTRELLQGSTSNFPVGSTLMEYLIENESGESTTCQFQVTILEAPSVSIARSSEMACTDSDYQLSAEVTEENYYDTWEWDGPNNFKSFERNPAIKLVKASAGTYQVRATASNSGCFATATTEIEVFGLEGTPAINTDQAIICQGESVSFRTEGVDGATYQWEGPNSFLSNDLSVDFQNASPIQTGNYTLTRTVDGCTSPPTSVRLIVLSEILSNDDVINTFINNSITFDVLANDTLALDAPFSIRTLPDMVSTLVDEGDGMFTYTPEEGFVGVDQFTYEICYDACPDLCGEGLLTFRVAASDEVCSFPTFLSPNGDEDNETLIFPCNDADNANSTGGITIFNQYGAIVYQAYPYHNDWQGTYNGEPLPDGTYYYIYKETAEDADPIKNCVTIFR